MGHTQDNDVVCMEWSDQAFPWRPEALGDARKELAHFLT